MNKELQQMKLEASRIKYPNLPEYARITKSKGGKSKSNQLTSDVVMHIDLCGHWATRVNTMGRVLNGKYITGTTKNGTPDVIACIGGKFVGIEIKIKDKQSDAQKKVEADIHKAQGYYFIVHTFDEWLTKYKELCSSR